jgi:hypothetical protein
MFNLILVVNDSYNDRSGDNSHAVRELLIKLHDYYLKDNKYDEGDLLFCRINYKLMDTLGITKVAAEEFHKIYHDKNPRRVSEGYCNKCKKIVTIIPIIYGVSNNELPNLLIAENNGKLIIGNTNDIKDGSTVAIFGCGSCKSSLQKFGTM